MPLDDPYGAGIWGQWSQDVAQQPLIAGKIVQQGADTAKTQAETDAQALKNTEALQTSAPRVASVTAGYGSTAAADNLTAMRAKQASVADIVSHYDWSDPDEAKDGDAQLAKARDGGNDIAGSLVGRVSSQNADRLAEAYGATTPHAARAATTLTGTGQPGDPTTSLYGAPKVPEVTPQALAAVKDPAILQNGIQTNATLLQALEHIQTLKDPAQAAATFDAYAASHNRPDLIGQYGRDPGILNQLESQVRTNMTMAQQELERRASGLPAPTPDTKIVQAGDGRTVAVTPPVQPGQPAGVQTLTGQEDKWTINPWVHDKDGNAMESNERTGQTRVIADSGARQSVYGQRVEVANSLYKPGSQQWADYVQGKGTGLTQAQALQYGESQAQKEGAGLWTPAQTEARAEAIAGDIMTAQTQGAAPAAGAGTPAPGGAAPGPNGLTAAQATVAQRYAGTKDPVGKPGNPYTPRTEAEWKGLPTGSVYIDPNGQLATKGAPK